MFSDLQVRQATSRDASILQGLLGIEFFVHRHLDWNSPLDWLETPPFLVCEKDNRILAALACPEDPPGVCWVHLFLSVTEYKPAQTWKALFPQALEFIQSQPHIQWLAAISLQHWFTAILQENGFHQHQEIVVLERELTPALLSERTISPPPRIRPMEAADLQQVTEVDRLSFHPLWQNSFSVLKAAWRQAAYCTVLEVNDKIMGYQISTSSIFNAHLARLAIHPAVKRQGYGSALLQDLSAHFFRQGGTRLTVNTQQDNDSSLALYQQAGFSLTGDSYPVFAYPLSRAE